MTDEKTTCKCHCGCATQTVRNNLPEGRTVYCGPCKKAKRTDIRHGAP
ncbi:MAG TPA: hypothetical protein VFY79_01505 [Dehalococcoidia bacterium]|jgi:hypothetical protein|nr:hypothetical protein [Dehalococcoidia bacterium]